ncbi:MAG: DUF1294 domain-containing protein [Butyrivibrio sp.]|nr:DUF1294 domain-containing protein [Butyrivibrio sp.]
MINSLLLICCYLAAVNLIGFALMGIDKRRAKRMAFRIPEATLFSVALVGGSIGTTLGMFLFHHKTKHWYFRFGMPIIIIIQIVLILVLHFGPLTFSFL